ncbi:hypothetical protein JDV02_002078 [Purpureocillium takamizusanense]|uniref:Uncharacterized protein n=1 Tax=Purpureocillium takamizusanense TaxID=2060973 RepID=A0A9Q8QAM6_9HYPO|nr:uncharacterized protein JDV02_002078 [Purpureocillium takamizusanense]UNI15554.1 hypothetical protein JDV02_002078 [Purpureocillium takamizusanense]
MPRRSTRLSDKAATAKLPERERERETEEAPVPASTTTSGVITQAKATKKKNKPRTARASASTSSSSSATPSTSSTTTPATEPSSTTASSSPSSSSTTPEIISFPDAASFTAWLSLHGSSTPSGILLRIAKKSSPVPSVSYLDAVDVALCHGWIDGQRRRFLPAPSTSTASSFSTTITSSTTTTSSSDDANGNAHFFLQRFTPRRPRSLWSRRNVDRVAALTALDRMQPAGWAEVEAARADGRWERAYAGPAAMETPRDFEDALRAYRGDGDGDGDGDDGGGGVAWRRWEALGRSKRYPFLWRIATVKREETRRRKIDEYVRLLAEGKTLS